MVIDGRWGASEGGGGVTVTPKFSDLYISADGRTVSMGSEQMESSIVYMLHL